MLSSGELARVVSVLQINREIYREKHRDDKLLSEVFNKKGSPPKIQPGTNPPLQTRPRNTGIGRWKGRCFCQCTDRSNNATTGEKIRTNQHQKKKKGTVAMWVILRIWRKIQQKSWRRQKRRPRSPAWGSSSLVILPSKLRWQGLWAQQ